MLFNSFGFGIFLPIVFILYWTFQNKGVRAQNILLLIASYYFYSCWDYRFLFLLIFSTLLDFFTGIKMFESNSKKNKKIWFWISVCVNLGFLAFFKYYNFFVNSFQVSLEQFHLHADLPILRIILPVGISFYTFHGLSYVIDIYKGKIEPERNFVTYSLFVSFFPLLVAGPIERATHLLPQLKSKRNFDYSLAVKGIRQIIWGLFKKVVIADSLAPIVADIFQNYQHYNGLTLAIGAIYFAFQIYGDFSGYSDIAIGTANLFGIELLSNFKFPYFSRDIAEFWRRWHISLSSWFRDYLYFPLGGSREGKIKAVRNTFIIFIVSGFWHGASWNFIVWGAVHAILFLPLLLLNKNRKHTSSIVAQGRAIPNIHELFQMLSTFLLVTGAWVFFRAANLKISFFYLKYIFAHFALSREVDTHPFLLIGFMLILDWRHRNDDRNVLYFRKKWLRYCFYVILLDLIIQGLLTFSQQQFIYFQF